MRAHFSTRQMICWDLAGPEFRALSGSCSLAGLQKCRYPLTGPEIWVAIHIAQRASLRIRTHSRASSTRYHYCRIQERLPRVRRSLNRVQLTPSGRKLSSSSEHRSLDSILVPMVRTPPKSLSVRDPKMSSNFGVGEKILNTRNRVCSRWPPLLSHSAIAGVG